MQTSKAVSNANSMSPLKVPVSQVHAYARRNTKLRVCAYQSVPSLDNSNGLTAVVVGGGICGLLTSHVLCKHFDRVCLIEKDEILLDEDLVNESFQEVSRLFSSFAPNGICKPKILSACSSVLFNRPADAVQESHKLCNLTN